MYVCLCKAVTDGAIRRVIGEGARSVSDVARRTTAGTGCGGCHEAIEHLLAQHAEAAGEAVPVHSMSEGGSP